MEDQKKIRRLEEIDTPTITNIVASYPDDRENCLGLYHPWEINWYTDETIHAMFPEVGPKAGYAITVVYGLPDASDRLTFFDVLRAIDESPKPVVVCMQQKMEERYKKKNGLCGGNMMTAMRSAGAVALISDGPSRDLGEVRELGMQYMLTGVSPGHGNFSVKAINVPVSVCGMDVAPGEIVHLDENGACKFPAKYADQIYDLSKKLLEVEADRQGRMRETTDVEEIIRILSGFGE